MNKTDIEKKANIAAKQFSEKFKTKVEAVVEFKEWIKADYDRTYVHLYFIIQGEKFHFDAGFINNKTHRWNKERKGGVILSDIDFNKNDFSKAANRIDNHFHPAPASAPASVPAETFRTIHEESGTYANEYVLMCRYKSNKPDKKVFYVSMIKPNGKRTAPQLAGYCHYHDKESALSEIGDYLVNDEGIDVTELPTEIKKANLIYGNPVKMVKPFKWKR